MSWEDEGRSPMRLKGRLVAAAVGGAAVVVLLTTSLVAVRAAPSLHWAQSPYYPNCLEGPCRVVLVADKTSDPTFQAQVERWVHWMNFVRTSYNLKLPAFAYIPLTDPSCATAPGFISICRNDSVLETDCPGAGADTLRCTSFDLTLDGTGHITSSRSVFRVRNLGAADVWTVVCAAMGRSIGLMPNADSDSCMQDNLTLGSGQEKYYVGTDWAQLWSIYGHAAGS